MIHDRVELHNVAEVRQVASGVALQRVPEAVRLQLNETARMRVRQPDNVEIRFVCDGPARVTLSSEGVTDAVVFMGVMDARVRYRIGREPVTFEVPGWGNRLTDLASSHMKGQPFSSKVRRIIFGGQHREPVILHAVEGKGIRPPSRDMLPKRRYLVYGTSITQGFDCQGPHLSYVAQAARKLGVDLINLGVGGACMCEPAFADYIAGRDDWDFASLELSVNMRGVPMPEFIERVGYLVNKVAGSNTARPVACITLLPFFCDYGVEDPGSAPGGTAEEYRQALRDIVAACPHPNVHLIEGPDLLKDIGGLTMDLIHPGDYGMQEIGLNLAKKLRRLFARV